MWCNSENSLTTHETSWSIAKDFKGLEVNCLERKTKILLISTALLVATLSGIAALAYANNVNGDTNATTTITTPAYNDNGYFMGGSGHGGGHGCGMDPWTSITVSQGFKDNAINIAKNDTDFRNLLSQGYNITDVRPLINATVEADDTVTLKAASAIITLMQSPTTAQNTTTTTMGRALVWVNIDQAKVTRIVTMTKTVIEKP